MEIKIRTTTQKLTKSHKGRQSVHNKTTGRYVKQRYRTTRNKYASRQAHLANHPNDLQAIVTIAKAQSKFDVS